MYIEQYMAQQGSNLVSNALTWNWITDPDNRDEQVLGAQPSNSVLFVIRFLKRPRAGRSVELQRHFVGDGELHIQWQRVFMTTAAAAAYAADEYLFLTNGSTFQKTDS